MKRKLTILSLCAGCVVVAGLWFSGRDGTGKAPGTHQTQMVITQGGKLTVVPRETHGSMRLIADLPKPTNAPAAGAYPAKK